MSRPIKFRAWDKKTNKKYFVSSIDMFGKVVTILDDRGDTLDFIERAIHNVELMQFTGLTDRNGVEIYEQTELNDKYIVTYKAPRFVLYEISSGDIIDINEQDEYKITSEYKPLPKIS